MENNITLLQRQWKNKLAYKDMMFVLGRLGNIDDKQAVYLSTQPLKSPILVWILTFFGFGFLGIDRFYKGDISLGILKLIISLVMMLAIVVGYNAEIFYITILFIIYYFIYCCEIITIISSTQKDNFIKILKALANVNVNK